MKNIIKKSLIIALCYYAIAISSCLNKQCNCPAPSSGKFNYTALRVANAQYTFTGDTTFSSINTTADTVEKSKYGIHMSLDYKITAALRNTVFFNAAYGCDCVVAQFFIEDKVNSISVITLRNIDAGHPAGSEVNDFFRGLDYTYSPQRILYYDALTTELYNHPANPSATGINDIDLYLKNAGLANQEIAFEVTFTFASGNKLTAQTKPIFLK